MPEKFDTTANRINESISSGNAERLDETIDELAQFCFKDAAESQFSEDTFTFITNLMQKEQFQRMHGAFRLLAWFEYDWGAMTSNQKDRLLESIEQSYDKYSDWMSFFVLSELLGEYYCNGKAFEVLSRLSATGNETARALIPMGFEKLAKNTDDRKLKVESISQIRKFLADRSSTVRNEAAECMARLEQQ